MAKSDEFFTIMANDLFSHGVMLGHVTNYKRCISTLPKLMIAKLSSVEVYGNVLWAT